MENSKLDYIRELAFKRENGSLTEKESAFLEAWYLEHNDETLHLPKEKRMSEDALKRRLTNNVLAKINEDTQAHRFKISLRYFTAAAAILIVVGSFLFLILQKPNDKQDPSTKITINDVQPGTNKATLTLANGKSFDLSQNQGELNADKALSINNQNGKLAYSNTNDLNTSDSKKKGEYLNTLSVPMGGEYELKLSDGTVVILNSGSEIRFPEQFADDQRLVYLKGEAYFQVAKNKMAPFRVVSDKQTIEVLGTTFNLNSYDNEPNSVTTLVEGSVRVTNQSGSKIMQPGEAAISGKNSPIKITEADIQTALAWKNGQILFKKTDVETIMRQIARWYNIDIIIEDGALRGKAFTGGLPRTSPLTVFLEILKASEIKYELFSSNHKNTLKILK